ncbi:pentapeptide repeat-containing protein [Microbispora sp. NPDC088329]|uniref:pentapeptide repeat-containing protein n=1 Tax=Microbispora sp. NPDC088329 TaxID=3154869 RepID=UPI00341400D7
MEVHILSTSHLGARVTVSGSSLREEAVGVPDKLRKSSNQFRWLWVWLALIIGLASGSSATVLLWGKGTADHKDAIDLGWKIAAAALAILATFITVQRLRLGQQEHLHKVDVDQAVGHDAAERRITDLYAKAAEHIGHEKAAVRLAGMYALERIAQNYQEHRQTIVDVICAYLRMPYTPPPGTSVRSVAERISPSLAKVSKNTQESGQEEVIEVVQELQVRLAAQDILCRHLRCEDSETSNNSNFWKGMRVNLIGAYLEDLDFENCRPESIECNNATFAGVTNFNGAQFEGDADFYDAVFHSATWFGAARFCGTAGFGGAKFMHTASFMPSTFFKDAVFTEVEFRGDTVFAKTLFRGDAIFAGATFAPHTQFVVVNFTKGATFEDAKVDKSATFEGISISGESQQIWPLGWRLEPYPDGRDEQHLVYYSQQKEVDSMSNPY